MATINGTFNSLVGGTISGSVGVPGPAGQTGPAGPQGLPGTPGAPGVGVPAGGLTGQVLLKVTDTSYDTAWFDNYAATVQSTVRNETGATLTKGTVVYISGASGNKPLVSKASASTEAGSSKTFAILAADILTNQNGQAVTMGLLKGLDTSAFTAGANLWLSTTPGQIVSPTPPASPAHAVFLGNVVRVHATQGEIEVRIQNGYELGELHDVLLTSPTNGQVLKYDSASGLWVNGNVPADFITSVSSPLSVNSGVLSVNLAGYATESFVTSQGYITSSALAPYLTSSAAAATYFTIASAAGKANLSGATFTGKVNLPDLGVNTPSLNLGGTALSTTATSASSGDVWISGATSPKLTYKVGGANLYCATSNLTNTFTSSQIIDVTTATSAALRVTQKGTGNAIEVEDSTSPDSTRFVVDQFGKVGVGVAPDATAALKVDTNGIMFGNGSVQTVAANPFTGGAITTPITYDNGSGYISTFAANSIGINEGGDTVPLKNANFNENRFYLFSQQVGSYSDIVRTAELSLNGFSSVYTSAGFEYNLQMGVSGISFSQSNSITPSDNKAFSLGASGVSFRDAGQSTACSFTPSGITFQDGTVQTTAATGGGATESWVSSNFYPLSGNPSGFVDSGYVSSYAYPLSGNPSGFMSSPGSGSYVWYSGGWYPANLTTVYDTSYNYVNVLTF
jgi:hypothetical protein